MELTNELKARFFALYWGQIVCKFEKIEGYVGKCWEDHFNKLHPMVSPIGVDHLILRPLSSITDEELTHIGNLLGWVNHPAFVSREKGRTLIEFLCDPKQRGHRVEANEFSAIIDCLRSKRFLLPFMGIPSDQWVEWGLVKLKTDTKL